jgi:hypothetical protein
MNEVDASTVVWPTKATPDSVQGFAAAGAPSFKPSTNDGGAGAFSIGTGGAKKTPGRRIVKAKRPISFSPRMTSTEQMDASSSSLVSGDDGEAVCYLCLDGDADEAGQQLRRDCACRGTDAGFVHLSCLAKYAATKSKQAISMNRTTCMDEFIKPWLVCPSCDQYYQNELAVDIAAEFVLFVRGQYPRDTQLQLEALHVKLCALDSMLDRPTQRREAGASANVLLSLITRMKGEMSPMPMPTRYSSLESSAHSTLGAIALKERTEESARRAVVHFENQIEVYEAIGHAEGVATAKANVAIAKAMYEDDNNNEEVLVTRRELYEMNVAKYGEEHAFPIDSGVKYASALQRANRGGRQGHF